MSEGARPAGEVLRDLRVPMRDGVRLATDAHLPAGPGPFPVVLERTPYGKTLPSRSELEPGSPLPMSRAAVAAHFTRHGYAVVYQDCRGRHGSEGEFTKYLSEGADGHDTMAWLVAQPWCNGRIGTMGLSYAAHTQMAAACLDPPGLACMIVDSGGFANAHRCGVRQGGAFELKQATWAWNQARESPQAQADPLVRAALEAEDLRAWFTAMPWREGCSPVRWVPEYERYLLEQWRHGRFDAYWQQVGIHAAGYHERIPRIPIALMSSWYDAYVSSTLDNLEGLRGERPVALIMGAGLHGNRNTCHAGDVDFGPQAALSGQVAPSWLEFRRRWFDRWLQGRDNGVDTEPPVRLFLMGGGSGGRTAQGRLEHGGRWIEAAHWPLPGTRFIPWYLHGDGHLSTTPPAAEAPALEFDFDPADPVPTLGGALTSGQPVFEGGAFDQRESPRFFGCRRPGLPLSARADVLSFESEVLTEDLAVVGPIRVELRASSDAPDTDFTAKLIDVHPPSAAWPTGFAMNLSDGILRCRYRHSWSEPEPVVPGEVMQLVIEPFATANLFRAGHRIRVDISSSNFPKYDVNPNTGAPEGRGRARRVARNTVFCDAARASRIVLPIVPVATLRALRPPQP